MSGNTTQSSSPLNFIFPLGQNPQVNLDAAHTNTFYLVNTIHDYTYRCIVLLSESRRTPLTVALDMVSRRPPLTSRLTISERVDWETTV